MQLLAINAKGDGGFFDFHVAARDMKEKFITKKRKQNNRNLMES